MFIFCTGHKGSRQSFSFFGAIPFLKKRVNKNVNDVTFKLSTNTHITKTAVTVISLLFFLYSHYLQNASLRWECVVLCSFTVGT